MSLEPDTWITCAQSSSGNEQISIAALNIAISARLASYAAKSS